MRVFISADIEGTDFTAHWDEATPGNWRYPAAAQQMTAEVVAACEGAIAAGADYILIKDAHNQALNIDPNQLPKCAELIRGWSGDPMGMAEGVDSSFDVAMFVGYHSAAGSYGNPLSHTETKKTTAVRLNGQVCSEFLIFSQACAMLGVPTAFLSGDKNLTVEGKALYPWLHTVAVKEGRGDRIRCLQPQYACDCIREEVEKALKETYTAPALPEHFELEISYKEQADAVHYANYPGFELKERNTIRMETDSYMDILRAVQFVF